MTGKSADEIRGLELDWIASDADGNVALFTTAGGGYAPEELLQDTDAHDSAIDAILESPASTKPRFAPELPPTLPNTWRAAAERGLFAFDSHPNGGPYRLVAAPEAPARVADLPARAAAVVRRVAFRDLRFAELTEVPVERLKGG